MLWPEKRLAGAFHIVFARTGPVAYCLNLSAKRCSNDGPLVCKMA